MDGDVTKRYVDIKRVSGYTSLPIKPLYDWSNQVEVPCIKIGRRIFSYIKDVDEAMSNLKKPLLKLENSVNNARNRWLTIDEEKSLLDISPEWSKQILIFSLNTDLRLGELTRLEWSRVNIFKKTILIQ